MRTKYVHNLYFWDFPTFKADGRGCDCVELEIVTTNEAVRRKHGDLLGKYTKMEKIKGFSTSFESRFRITNNLYYFMNSEILYFQTKDDVISMILKPKIRF